MYSRRQVLAGATAVAGTVLGGTASSVTATDDGDWENAGDTIHRSDDLEQLRRYMPFLRISRESQKELIGFYGWKAESPDHDTDVFYYWARYTHQDAAADQFTLLDRALGVLASDAHLWDHEPSAIYVNQETGEVEKAIVTGYHHYPIEIDGENAPLIEDRVDGRETHLSLTVVDPWHHYMFDHDERGTDVTNFAVFESWLEVRSAWQANGFYDNSSAAAIDNPWTLKDGREMSWWDESTRDARAAKLWHMLGLRGAGDTASDLEIPSLWPF